MMKMSITAVKNVLFDGKNSLRVTAYAVPPPPKEEA